MNVSVSLLTPILEERPVLRKYLKLLDEAKAQIPGGRYPNGPCTLCDGRGTVPDWIGLEMKCIEVDCEKCHGTGKQ